MIDALASGLSSQGGWVLVLPCVAALVGASVQRTTGFGFGFIAGAGMLSVFNPIVAVVYTTIANVFLSGVSAWQLRQDINYRVTWLLVIWLGVGTIAGLAVIGIALRWWLQSLALVVTFWSIYQGVSAMRARHRKSLGAEAAEPPSASWPSASVPGILAGFLGTCLAIPGPPVIGYLMRLGMSPSVVRATLLAFFSLSSLSRLIVFPFLFAMPTFNVVVLTLIVTATIIGTVFGVILSRIVPENWFAYINLSALTGSAIVLLGALVMHFVTSRL